MSELAGNDRCETALCAGTRRSLRPDLRGRTRGRRCHLCRNSQRVDPHPYCKCHWHRVTGDRGICREENFPLRQECVGRVHIRSGTTVTTLSYMGFWGSMAKALVQRSYGTVGQVEQVNGSFSGFRVVSPFACEFFPPQFPEIWISRVYVTDCIVV